MTQQPLSTDCDALAEALRDELQEYGELLNLLRRQQASILGREPEGVLGLVPLLNHQAAQCAELRFKRESLSGDFAHANGEDRQRKLTELLPLFPQGARALVGGLIAELNATLERLQRCARQNHMLLGRSVEVTGEIVRTLKPEVITRTYTRKGVLNLRAPAQGACIRKTV